jgi:tRNA uridine 5-carbamoylmethylation protein Kti12
MNLLPSTQNTQEMNNLQNFSNATFESVYVDLQEVKRFLAEKSAETDKIIKEAGKEIKETDRLIKETRKDMKETDRLMKELQKQYGGVSNSNGEMAEEYFYRAFKRNKTFAHESFEKVLRNKCIDNDECAAEFDLLLLNGKCVAIIEVKYRAKPDNISIEELVSRIEPFKVLFPDYKNHNIYLGVAALSFDKRLAKQLHKAGIATIHQEGKKMVVYDQEIKMF